MAKQPDWSKISGKPDTTREVSAPPLPRDRDMEATLDAINQVAMNGPGNAASSSGGGGSTGGSEVVQLLSRLVENSNEMLELIRQMAGDEGEAHG